MELLDKDLKTARQNLNKPNPNGVLSKEKAMTGNNKKNCATMFNQLCWLVDCAQNACDTAERTTTPLPETLQKDLEDLQRAIKKAKSTIFQNV